MAHETINITLTREWARSQAKLESDGSVTSVGGLAQRASGIALKTSPTASASVPEATPDPRRQSLGKFVELSRRRLRISVEQLADQANIDLRELLAIEYASDVTPEPRTIFQLATILRVKPEPLMELAGLVVRKNTALTESAVRFAARSEPMQELSADEEAALNWFVNELTKS